MAVNAPPVPALTTFYVYLTSGCNCACQHCWFVPDTSATGASTDRLDQQLLRQAVKQALPLGLRAIKWTGGEPTFHPQFREFLALQKEFKLDGLVESNGMLIDDSLAVLMMETGVRQVSISLDGACAETHDLIRGVPGGYERTLNGISSLVAAGYQPELILTLQRGNCGELEDYFLLAQQLGAGNVKLNILQPVLRGAELQEKSQHLDVPDILELAAAIEQRTSHDSRIPVQLGLPMAFRPLSKILSGEQAGSCTILNIMGILPRGDYALCGVGQHVKELSMGHILDQSLEKVWETHPVLSDLRQGLPNRLQGTCHSCLMKTTCKGSCVAANYQLSGDLFAPYWFCQQAAELGLFPQQRKDLEKAND